MRRDRTASSGTVSHAMDSFECAEVMVRARPCSNTMAFVACTPLLRRREIQNRQKPGFCCAGRAQEQMPDACQGSGSWQSTQRLESRAQCLLNYIKSMFDSICIRTSMVL